MNGVSRGAPGCGCESERGGRGPPMPASLRSAVFRLSGCGRMRMRWRSPPAVIARDSRTATAVLLCLTGSPGWTASRVPETCAFWRLRERKEFIWRKSIWISFGNTAGKRSWGARIDGRKRMGLCWGDECRKDLGSRWEARTLDREEIKILIKEQRAYFFTGATREEACPLYTCDAADEG